MRVLVICNARNPKTVDSQFQMRAYFDSLGVEMVSLDVTDLPDAAFPYSGAGAEQVDPQLAGDFQLMVTLGGDGTILHASRLAHVLDVPMLGVNFGHMGFLANSADDGALSLLADALSDEVMRENRVNLRIQVECEGDDVEPPDTPREFFAMNEIAIARGAAGHIVDFSYAISGEHIAKMRGDGLIVSTATGSTAYALSAGGPLVGPTFNGLIVVPLAPHTLVARAIVAERNDVVEVTIPEGSASAYELSLFADGDALELGRPISVVRIMAGERPTVLLNRRDESFYKQVSRTFFN